MKKICLITCYMGPLPNYFGYYLATCKANSSIHFIIINDNVEKSYTDENVRFIKMNLDGLNNYSSAKLGWDLHLASSWKINELKPLFGKIFEEQLSGFDFWGWCDLDIIWGNLRNFLTEELLSAYDVIAPKANWTAGHFTLFRNNGLCNTLFARNKKITELLNSSTYFAFEECCHRWDGAINSPEVLDQQGLYVSMFDIVKNAESNKEIRALFKDVIREYPQPVNYLYKNPRLIDLKNNEEFMYYHLITVKKIWRFYIPQYTNNCKEFSMTHRGIYCHNSSRFLWELKRLLHSLKGMVKSAGKQSPGKLIKKLFKFRRTWI